MPTIDSRLFLFMNQKLSNPAFDFLMPLVTQMGTSGFLILAGIALLFLRDPRRRRLALLLFAGIAVTYALNALLKGWIARPRPSEVLAGVNLLVKPGSGFSFPSGHAAMAFMAQVIVSHGFRKWRIAFLAYALLVAFSRIYVGAHYPFDVLAGSIVGIAGGFLTLAFARWCRVEL
jgi:undecaprenyl-diphosphatase